MERENLRERFERVYSILKSDVLQHPAFEHDSSSHQWVENMLDYTVPGGKLSRGFHVVQIYVLLKNYDIADLKLQENEDEDGVFLASVLGWCIQWLVAGALVFDDIVDDSYTRRGRPCRFRVPSIGMIAINDGVLLGTHVHLILKKYFRDRPYYVDLLELFNEISSQTTLGQMLDLMTGERDLSSFTTALHTRISKYKTAYGTFYFPFACALLVLGERIEEYEDVKDLLLEIGVHFQVQDDYLDCYGDPEKVGKIGTDIQDFKCSWLMIKALEMCNEEQRKVLYDNYGKADQASVDAVKGVYKELELQRVYAEYEIAVYEKLVARIEAVQSIKVQVLLKVLMNEIHERKK